MAFNLFSEFTQMLFNLFIIHFTNGIVKLHLLPTKKWPNYTWIEKK
jgi:hypothetical protein